MPSLLEILRDPNYINANPATKQAIFERWAPQDQNYTGANDATKQAIRQRFGVGVAAEPEMDQPKDEGFFTNVGKLALEGGERAIGAAKVSPSVISGNVGKEQAKGIAEQLAMKPTVQPKELTEVTTAFRDEAEALKKAQGFKESVVPTLQFMGEFGKQALTNPKGIAYLTAQSAANMAPSILGMIALGKAGAAAGTVVAPGPGTAIGGVGGAMLGGFSGGAPIEIGAQFIENVGKELSARGMEPTQENVEALLSDKKFVDKAVSEARTKGTTTAAVDAVMTAGAGRYATGPRRAAIKAAQTEMGVAADAAAVAKRAEEILKQGTKAERAVRAVKRGAGAVGIDVAGGGLSEAAGQYAAFGEVDPESVALEMLGELGGSAIEVPSAAYATGRDALKAKAKTDAAKILEEQAEQQRLAAERSAEEERMRPIREAEARVPAEEPVGPSITRTGRAALMGGAEPMTSTDPLAAAISARRQEREDAEVERERRARVEIPGAEEPTFNILRGLEARNQGLMSTLEARRTAAEEQAEVTRQERESKAAAERADADRRMSQVENFLLSPARKTQQETADYIAGVVPEMRKDFLALLDEDLNQPLTPEQTEALKTQIRQRLMPEAAPEPEAGRTRFKRFLATMGINKQDASDIFGDNAFRANQRLPGAIRADAPRLDMLAEAAVEAGFLQTEDPDVLAQMIKDEFFGVEQVPLDMAEERAAAELEERRLGELQSRAAEIGLDTRDMTPDQIIGRLNRIERTRAQQRQRRERETEARAEADIAEATATEREARAETIGAEAVPEVEALRLQAREQGIDTGAIEEQAFEEARENPDLNPDTILAERLSDALGVERRYQKETLAQGATDSGINIDPEDQRIEKELTGKSMIQVADWAIQNAPNAFARVIAEKVKARLLAFQRKGMTLDFKIQGGQNRTLNMRGARGVTQFDWGKDDKGTTITVTLNGAAVLNNQAGYPPGTRYSTVLHELLHVATRAQFVFMPNTDPLKKQMIELFNAVADRFNADAKAGNLPPVMMKYYKRMNNVLEDPDEMLAWGLTDRDVQEYFDDIKVGEKSVWSQLVELIRKALGLGKPYESALERLVRASDSLLEVDVNSIDDMLGLRGKQIGGKRKPAGPMVQESLFQKEGKPAAMREEVNGFVAPTASEQNNDAFAVLLFGNRRFVFARNGAAIWIMDSRRPFDFSGLAVEAGDARALKRGDKNWPSDVPVELQNALHNLSESVRAAGNNINAVEKSRDAGMDAIEKIVAREAGPTWRSPTAKEKDGHDAFSVLEFDGRNYLFARTGRDVLITKPNSDVIEFVVRNDGDVRSDVLSKRTPKPDFIPKDLFDALNSLTSDVNSAKDQVDRLAARNSGMDNVEAVVESIARDIMSIESKPAAMREGRVPQTETEAFKRWFGGSKVVDAEGRPLVVYHGTSGDFTAFDMSKLGDATGSSSAALGIFSTADPSVAAIFSGQKPDETTWPRKMTYAGGANVMPVYVSVKNPIVIPAKEFLSRFVRGGDDAASFRKEAIRAGHDGILISGDSALGDAMGGDEYGADAWVAFRPEQIKSATGNIGTFSPETADIRYQREAEPEEARKSKPTRLNIAGEPILGSWVIQADPQMEIKDGLIYKFLDKNVDIKRIVQTIEEKAGEIAAQWNPYLKEELYHGRVAKATEEFRDKEWQPLLDEMKAMDVQVGELEQYLLNRHAEEYNKHIAKVNPTRPEMQDGGSSVTTEDARAYLASLPKDKKAKYEALAKRVDKITKGTRDLLVETGYEKPETIKAWENAFPNYVPLFREEGDFDYNFGSFGTGRGFDVRRSFSRSAMGSKRQVVDIIANVIGARNNAIILTEKNRVAQAVYGLALESPNPDFWLAINPDAEKQPADVIDELKRMGLDEDALKNLAMEPRQRALDPKKNEVVSRINNKLRENDNVLATRINGERRYVFFNPKDERSKRAATALKNLDAEDLGMALGFISSITRWMAAVNTQYNPIFGPYNFLRDVQAAALQLSTTPLAGQQKEISKYIVPSLKTIYSSLRKRRKGEEVDTELGKLWQEFQKEGGQTGFKDVFSRTQDRQQALVNELTRMSEGKLKGGFREVGNWLSDYNDSLENAVRLSAYKVAKEKFLKEGKSVDEAKQRAASLAKNLTVNFNRKGQVATQMGALYAFFNASMQGTARLYETLKGPMGKKIIAGGLLLGAMQAALLAAAGFDDEEPPDFVRERNIIIPLGGDKYFAFPMPLGFHVIPGISRILTEWTLSGFKDTPERVASLTGMFLEAFNPVGNAGWSLQTGTPTFLDPFIALAENKDWTGKPIYKEDLFALRPTPGYTRAKEATNEFYKSIAEFLNLASGGTKYQKGMFSPTPEQIEYLVGQATGGVGREISKLITTGEKLATGEELPSYKIPLAGRFYGETKSSAAESSRFYKNMERLNKLNAEIKGRRDNREPLGDFMRENPEARLAPMAEKTYKDIQQLRKRREQLVERDAPRESVKAVEEQIKRRMAVFNERVARLSE